MKKLKSSIESSEISYYYRHGNKIMLEFNDLTYLGIPSFLLGKDYEELDTIKIDTKDEFCMSDEYLCAKPNTRFVVDDVETDDDTIDGLLGVIYPFEGEYKDNPLKFELKNDYIPSVATNVYLIEKE